jgi:hypothetical protein
MASGALSLFLLVLTGQVRETIHTHEMIDYYYF